MAQHVEKFLWKPVQNTAAAPFLAWIKEGKKTYEGRLFEKCREWDLKVGKRMGFYDSANVDDKVTVEITELLPFTDFGAAYDALGEKLLPEKARAEVIELYNELFHYDHEDLAQLKANGEPSQMINITGVVAIGLKVVK